METRMKSQEEYLRNSRKKNSNAIRIAMDYIKFLT